MSRLEKVIGMALGLVLGFIVYIGLDGREYRSAMAVRAENCRAKGGVLIYDVMRKEACLVAVKPAS